MSHTFSSCASTHVIHKNELIIKTALAVSVCTAILKQLFSFSSGSLDQAAGSVNLMYSLIRLDSGPVLSGLGPCRDRDGLSERPLITSSQRALYSCRFLIGWFVYTGPTVGRFSSHPIAIGFGLVPLSLPFELVLSWLSVARTVAA